MKFLTICISAAMLVAGAVTAAPVTIYWSGTAQGISTSGSNPDFDLLILDRVGGSFTYDPAPFASAAVAGADGHSEFQAMMATTVTLNDVTWRWVSAEQNLNNMTSFGGFLKIDNDDTDTGGTGSIFLTRFQDNDLGTGALASDNFTPDGPFAITRDGAAVPNSFAQASYQISDVNTGLFGPDLALSEIDLGDFSQGFMRFTIQKNAFNEQGLSIGDSSVSATVAFDYWSASAPRPEDPTINPVPLPAAGWLLLVCVAGLATLQKRKKERC